MSALTFGDLIKLQAMQEKMEDAEKAKRRAWRMSLAKNHARFEESCPKADLEMR